MYILQYMYNKHKHSCSLDSTLWSSQEGISPFIPFPQIYSALKKRQSVHLERETSKQPTTNNTPIINNDKPGRWRQAHHHDFTYHTYRAIAQVGEYQFARRSRSMPNNNRMPQFLVVVHIFYRIKNALNTSTPCMFHPPPSAYPTGSD